MSDRNYQTFFCYLHGETEMKCDCVNQVQKSTEERRCENCWFSDGTEGQYIKCRFNAPIATDDVVYVDKKQWCGRFYSKEMPPPWKPQLIHRLEPT